MQNRLSQIIERTGNWRILLAIGSIILVLAFFLNIVPENWSPRLVDLYLISVRKWELPFASSWGLLAMIFCPSAVVLSFASFFDVRKFLLLAAGTSGIFGWVSLIIEIAAEYSLNFGVVSHLIGPAFYAGLGGSIIVILAFFVRRRSLRRMRIHANEYLRQLQHEM